MHEPVTTGISGQIIEECAHQLPILWQDRPDDDALAQVHDVDKLRRIAINLVSHHIHGVRSDHGIDLAQLRWLATRFLIKENWRPH